MYRRSGGGCVGLLAGLALIIIVLLLLGAFTGYGLGIGIADSKKVDTGTVPVNGTANLTVTNQIGSITIQPSTDGQIDYTIVRHGWSFTSSTADAEASRMKFSVTPNGNNVTITGEQPAGLLRFNIGNQNTIDMLISVPPSAIVSATINVGNATINNPDGALAVSANAGTITVSGAKLSGPLNLSANAGSINFSGKLGLGTSANKAQANAGSVTMNLAAGNKYDFNVKSDVGGVETNFTVPNGVQRAGTGATLIGITNEGEGAAIPLQVAANAGSVKIDKLGP